MISVVSLITTSHCECRLFWMNSDVIWPQNATDKHT